MGGDAMTVETLNPVPDVNIPAPPSSAFLTSDQARARIDPATGAVTGAVPATAAARAVVDTPPASGGLKAAVSSNQANIAALVGAVIAVLHPWIGNVSPDVQASVIAVIVGALAISHGIAKGGQS